MPPVLYLPDPNWKPTTSDRRRCGCRCDVLVFGHVNCALGQNRAGR